MKIIIIISIILILFIYFINNKKKENLVTTTNIDTYLKKCSIGNNNLYSNINILNNLLINDRKFSDFVLDYAYPIGSFYVQFPDLNKSIKIYSSETAIAFPDSQTPEKLFGGYWQEQWPTESIYFRTRGMLSNENRNDFGFQNYATKHLYGSVDSYGKYNGEDIVSGAFKKIDSPNKIYSSNLQREISKINLNLQSQINVSDVENRVENRVIKIWKRVAKLLDNKYPNLPNNGVDPISDKNYYSGPFYGKTFTNYTILNSKSLDEAVNICNQTENCKLIGKKDTGWYLSSDSTMVAGDKHTVTWEKKNATFRLKRDDVFKPYIDLEPAKQEEYLDIDEGDVETYIEEEERPEGWYDLGEIERTVRKGQEGWMTGVE